MMCQARDNWRGGDAEQSRNWGDKKIDVFRYGEPWRCKNVSASLLCPLLFYNLFIMNISLQWYIPRTTHVICGTCVPAAATNDAIPLIPLSR